MKIFKSEGKYIFLNFSEILDELPPGNYIMKYDQLGQRYYLENTVDFRLPSKIYGDLEKHADRYLKVFDRGGNLGILLNGEKGSGKTLLSKIICAKSKVPIIQIEQKFTGTEFVSYINNIQQKCIILIDEFDKLYKEYDYDDEGTSNTSPQLELLRLLDGGLQSDKMFIFTSNEQVISQYMINRPSRIRYKQEFGKLTESIVKEVLEDKLDDKKYIKDFLELNSVFLGFNLDTLLILIDECNFMCKSPKELIGSMNIVPEATLFVVTFDDGTRLYEGDRLVEGSPLNMKWFHEVYFVANEPETKVATKSRKDQIYAIRSESPSWSRNMSDYDISAVGGSLVYTHRKDKYKVIYTPHTKAAMTF